MAAGSRMRLPQSYKPPMGGFRALQPAAPRTFYWPRVAEDEVEEVPGTGHLHWGITAFAEVTQEGNFADAVSIEVEGSTEQEAIMRAQNILVRPNYRVSYVREACSIDPTLRDAAKE